MKTLIIAFALVLIAASGDSFAYDQYGNAGSFNLYQQQQQFNQQNEIRAQQRQAQAMERQNQIMQQQYNQQLMDRSQQESNNLNYMIANPYRRGW